MTVHYDSRVELTALKELEVLEMLEELLLLLQDPSLLPLFGTFCL